MKKLVKINPTLAIALPVFVVILIIIGLIDLYRGNASTSMLFSALVVIVGIITLSEGWIMTFKKRQKYASPKEMSIQIFSILSVMIGTLAIFVGVVGIKILQFDSVPVPFEEWLVSIRAVVSVASSALAILYMVI